MKKNEARKEYLRKYYQAHKVELRERHNQNMREWRQRHPDRVKEINRQQYLRRKAKKGEGAGSGEQAVRSERKED